MLFETTISATISISHIPLSELSSGCQTQNIRNLTQECIHFNSIYTQHHVSGSTPIFILYSYVVFQYFSLHPVDDAYWCTNGSRQQRIPGDICHLKLFPKTFICQCTYEYFPCNASCGTSVSWISFDNVEIWYDNWIKCRFYGFFKFQLNDK